MSLLVNAVHELIEVAAGRRNLSGVAADELHAAIDAEQAPPAQDPEPEPIVQVSEPVIESGGTGAEAVPSWQS